MTIQTSTSLGGRPTTRYHAMFRCVATFMLLALVALSAGSFWHCVGRDGHHGIEKTHVVDRAHSDAGSFRHRHLAGPAEVIDSDDASCFDRLIFAEVLTSSCQRITTRTQRWPFGPRVPAASAAIPVVKPKLVSVAQFSTRKRFDLADAGLTTLRTVVLIH